MVWIFVRRRKDGYTVHLVAAQFTSTNQVLYTLIAGDEEAKDKSIESRQVLCNLNPHSCVSLNLFKKKKAPKEPLRWPI